MASTAKPVPAPRVRIAAPPAPVVDGAVALIADGTACCSKCDDPLDTTGYPHWCKKCQNAYRKEYAATKNEMQETRGYAAGISAMREFLAVNFEQYTAPRIFSGAEIAHIVRTCGEPVGP